MKATLLTGLLLLTIYPNPKIGTVITGSGRGIQVSPGAFPFSTEWLSISGVGNSSNTTPTDADGTWTTILRSGTVKQFYITVIATSNIQPATGSLVFTLYDNGVATPITATVPAGDTGHTFNDTTHSFALASGDKLTLRCTNNATTFSINIFDWSVTIQ